MSWLIPLAVALAQSTGPTSWYVDATANCALGTGTAARPFCTIREAVDAALDGDRILILPGTYAETLSLSKDLTIVGVAGFEATTIVPESTALLDFVLVPGDGTNTVLEGLTIRDGEVGGIFLNSTEPASLELRGCRVARNRNLAVVAQGGGIFARNADLRLVDTLVLENVCDPFPTSVTPDAFGAGIYVGGGSLTLDHCVVARNDNRGRCLAEGGGVYAYGADVVIRDTVIEDNTISGPGLPRIGGGVLVRSDLGGRGSLSIERSVVRRNVSLTGGGLWVFCPATVVDTELLHNATASVGSALHVEASVVTLQNTTIVGDSHARLVNLGAGSAAIVRSSILWRSSGATSPLGGDPAALAASSVDYSDILGDWTGTGVGNLAVDPGFRSVAGGDYRLMASSPCVDTGDPTFLSAGVDVGGFGRLSDGDLDRALRVDIGANELSNIELSLRGELVPGRTLLASTTAGRGFSSAILVVSTAPTSGTLLSPLGVLFAGLTAGRQVWVLGPPPTTTEIQVPATLPASSVVVFQVLGLTGPLGTKAAGNFSNAITRVAK